MTGASEVEVVSVPLDVHPSRLAACAARLSPSERARAQRLRFMRDRRRFLVTHARLRELLGARVRAEPEEIEFVYGRNGKPALAPRFAAGGWRFNLSHCEDLALFAFARGGEIGVDVEAVRALAQADEIAARFFSPRERAAYFALAPQHRSVGFFNCWTRKEACVKALGAGLSLPLDRFDVSLAPGEPARLLRIDERTAQGSRWRLQSFVPLPGFIAAVATYG